MPSCIYCKKRMTNKRLRCKECDISVLKGCVDRYLQSSKAKECCAKSSSLLPTGEVPSNAGTLSLVAIPHIGARALAVDTYRGIDPNLTLSDSSFNLATSSPIKAQDQSHLNGSSGSEMSTSSNARSLPENWNKISFTDPKS